MDLLTVVKRDRSKESFNREKIIRVVRAAGVAKDQAEQLAVRIADWLTKHHTKEITSLVIRDKVLEELRKINSAAAGLFEWYEKTKE
ncbi:hypothetical protein HY468_01495 [Candidatus Roizmanbacteria bacterium]|nr:hypothetical protein [Candidatus Roizmanbacteria bacterium]